MHLGFSLDVRKAQEVWASLHWLEDMDAPWILSTCQEDVGGTRFVIHIGCSHWVEYVYVLGILSTCQEYIGNLGCSPLSGRHRYSWVALHILRRRC